MSLGENSLVAAYQGDGSEQSTIRKRGWWQIDHA